MLGSYSTRNWFGVLNLCLPSVRWYKGMAEAQLVCIYHPCTVLDLYRSVLRSYFSSILGCVSFYACLLWLITHSRRAAVSFTCVYTHIWPFVCKTSLKSNAFLNDYSATKRAERCTSKETRTLLVSSVLQYTVPVLIHYMVISSFTKPYSLFGQSYCGDLWAT